MVDEQKADTELVGKILEDTKFSVVTAVGDLGSGCADKLEGVDGDQRERRVLPFEPTGPIADSTLN